MAKQIKGRKFKTVDKKEDAPVKDAVWKVKNSVRFQILNWKAT